MFEPSDSPRVFGVAPGVDFPKALIAGFDSRIDQSAPEDLGRVTAIVNTRRMMRRLRQIFDAGPARLLPRIRLLGDLDDFLPSVLPPAIPSLRRRLELVTLIGRLMDQDPTMAPRASLYDLADSLAALMDEMQGEGVAAETIAALDVSNFSEHFARTQAFVDVAQRYIAATTEGDDAEARQRKLVLRLADHWAQSPPNDPVILVGSTGSRGTTLMLMQAVARLPQGAVVLPGFDFDLPHSVWAHLSDALLSEDHPQYRFHKLMQTLGASARDVIPWDGANPPSATRNRLISLSLRPAPVTDAWRAEGPLLEALDSATRDITLVEAETPRAEAMAIAMRMRQAVETGQTAALITPDRMLSRQVTAALDRWRILPDDSAGMPLHLSPPGRLLRHVAGILTRRLEAEALLTLLKHPLTHSGQDRNLHQLNTQRLELRMRRDGVPYPTAEGIRALAAKVAARDGPEILEWAEWVAGTFCSGPVSGDCPLETWVKLHLDLSERIARGPDAGNSELWKKKAGEKAKEVMHDLAGQSEYGGGTSGSDYADLVGALLAQGEVRDRDAPHPDVMIWGTLEARVQGADLVILGGLNEGTWPEAPKPDPWLNRVMRHKAGLLLPERRIGLSAHDYQQAVAAPQVWITRAIRSDDAETVPSRWLNRLQNLLSGLEPQGGPEALAAMRARGAEWLARARALEAVDPEPRAPRPAPRPPVAARPRQLSVTEIKRLVRDPYAVYAKHCLRLRPLGPLVQTADALQKGRALHEVMEAFVKATLNNPAALQPAFLTETAHKMLAELVPWPTARALWQAGLAQNAERLAEDEKARQLRATPVGFEDDISGRLELTDLAVTLTARADRIDRQPEGAMILYDYKTGQPPTQKQQKAFDKQLLIEALMVEEGAFDRIGPAPVADAIFVGLGRGLKQERAPLDTEPPAKVKAELLQLIGAYLEPTQGFASRRAVFEERVVGDYDQLARFGEWDVSDDPVPEDVG